MRALGADLTLVNSVDGGIDEALTRNMIERAGQIHERTGGFWTDQLNNTDQLDAYRAMGDEIWRQTEGRVDAFVRSVGTAGSVRGVAESLRAKHPGIHIVAVEPAVSAVRPALFPSLGGVCDTGGPRASGGGRISPRDPATRQPGAADAHRPADCQREAEWLI